MLTVQEYIRKEVRLNIVINLVLNAVIVYATMHSLSQLSRWGEDGYGKDLIIGGVILSTILAGIFLNLFRYKRKKNQVIPDGDEGQNLAWLIPYNPWFAVPWMGVLGAIIAVPLLLGLLALFGVTTLSPIAYAAIKGVWSAVLAAFIVRIAILQGLRGQPE